MTTRSSVKGTRRNTPQKLTPQSTWRFWQREEMGISCASTDTIRFVGSSLGYPKSQKCQLGGIIPDAMGVDSSCEIMPPPPLPPLKLLRITAHMVSSITRRHTLCSFTRSFHNLRISFRHSISRRSSTRLPSNEDERSSCFDFYRALLDLFLENERKQRKLELEPYLHFPWNAPPAPIPQSSQFTLIVNTSRLPPLGMCRTHTFLSHDRTTVEWILRLRFPQSRGHFDHCCCQSHN